jgi:hypothetical protein
MKQPLVHLRRRRARRPSAARKIVLLVVVGLLGFGASNALAQSVTTTPLGGGLTSVAVTWSGETFSTSITGSGVAMPLPTFQKVCKFYPRLGTRCLTVKTDNAAYYTQSWINPTATGNGGTGQCQPTWVYVAYNVGTGGGEYAPTLPVSCVGSVASAASFTVHFNVVGSGTISVGATVVAIP